MPAPAHRARHRFYLADNQVVDHIYAATDGEAVQQLEQLRPGSSAHVVKHDRDDFWWLNGDDAAAPGVTH